MIEQNLRLFVVIIGGLTILSSLEVDIKALLGGLGIGGVAIALAVQDTVGNFIGTPQAGRRPALRPSRVDV